jgi:hypothetical protein
MSLLDSRKVLIKFEGPEKATRGGEWEPIKIPHRNLAYIPKSIRDPFLLTRLRLISYRQAISLQKWTRSFKPFDPVAQ